VRSRVAPILTIVIGGALAAAFVAGAVVIVSSGSSSDAPVDDATEAARVEALRRDGRREEADRRARALLARVTDPAAASTVVRILARGGCDRLTTTLTMLDHRARGPRALEDKVFLGLVEDALAASDCRGGVESPGVPTTGVAGPIARERAAARTNARLEALASADPVPIVRRRRAAALAEAGDASRAIDELRELLATDDHPSTRLRLGELLVHNGRADEAARVVAPLDGDDARSIRIIALAQLGRGPELARELAAAPADERLPLARLAVLRSSDPEFLARGVDPVETAGAAELLTAIAERLEAVSGADEAAPAYRRAVQASPRDAGLRDALAQMLAETSDVEGAIAAWDEAAALAPATDAYRLAPIQLLAERKRVDDARARARAIAQAARESRDADRLAFASIAAGQAQDRAAAVALAKEAQAARPDDGRLAFALAERLEEAGRIDEAIDAWVRLLACGAHGQPWHRHEVVGRLAEHLGSRARRIRARLANPGCPAVEPDDLADSLRVFER
jgi:tetratricopeptide (TPR) repeat protein